MHPTNRDRAFTLLEMLAATSVLVLIIALTSQVVGQMTTTAQYQTRQMDAVSSAGRMLDVLRRDIGCLVTQNGASLWAGEAGGNSKLAFFCSSRPTAANPGERMTRVSYNVRTASGNLVSTLCRDTRSVNWETDDYNFANVLSTDVPTDTSDAVLDGILAFNVAWLHNDGSIKQVTSNTLMDLSQLRGFTVTIATVDRVTLAALNRAGRTDLSGTFASAFAAPADGVLPCQQWNDAVAHFKDARLRGGIRIEARTYYLDR